ncbi:NTP transferase domain-containing protein [Salibacterium aidingense]|uniref:NTP transferase domain-containing protein n=1 Tax=Salibacterium aidingense TaxID=384933 RepID=UPI003BE2014D
MSNKKMTGIFLAAGKSSRMGESKLDLPLGQTTIGSRGLRTAVESNLEHILVVTKPEDSLNWVDPDLRARETQWMQVQSPQAPQGQAHSIGSGVKAANARHAEAVMILLGDQPYLSKTTINDLIEQHETYEKWYTASKYRERIQPPVIFSRSLFPLLLKLTGDKGARPLFHTLPREQGVTINYEDGRDFYDVDTKEDYRWLLENMQFQEEPRIHQ